jgi:hypothetical protein
MDRGIHPDHTTRLELAEDMRRRSKALFGNRDRLVVIAAVSHSDGIVCAADLERRTELANNRVRAQLIALTDAGLLAQDRREPRDRTQWYRRIPSPLWAACAALYEDWSGSSLLDD